MLAVDLFEFLGGFFVVLLLVEKKHALIIELVGRLVGRGIVLGRKRIPVRSSGLSPNTPEPVLPQADSTTATTANAAKRVNRARATPSRRATRTQKHR